MKLRHMNGGAIMFRCPGCECAHVFNNTWTVTGPPEAPTVKPSILVMPPSPCCHSFITDGRIQFLSDSAHHLAGQTVDVPDWDEALP